MTLLLGNVGLCVTVSEKKWDRKKEIRFDLLAKFKHADNLPEINLKGTEHKRLGPSQDVHFFYTRSHLSAL